MSMSMEAALKITAKDMTKPGLNSVERNLRGLRGELGRHNSAMGALGRTAAGVAAAYLTFDTAARAIAGLTTTAIAQDRALRGIGVTAGATALEIDRLRINLAYASKDTKTSTSDLTGVVDGLVAAGLSLEDAQASTSSIAMGAKAAAASLDDMTTSAVALLKSGGFRPEGLPRAMDMIVKSSKLGMVEAKQIAQELPVLAASAAKLGLDGEKGLASVLAMLQTIRPTTATASEAANNLNNFMQALTSPATSKALGKMGVSVEKTWKRTGETGEFVVDMLKQIRTQVGSDPIKLGEAFGDMQARAAVAALLADYDALQGQIQATAASAGEASKTMAARAEGAAAGVDRLSAAWSSLASVLAARVEPTVDRVANASAAVMEATTRTLTDQDYIGSRKRLLGAGSSSLDDGWAVSGITARAGAAGWSNDRRLAEIDRMLLRRYGRQGVASGAISVQDLARATSATPEDRAAFKARTDRALSAAHATKAQELAAAERRLFALNGQLAKMTRYRAASGGPLSAGEDIAFKMTSSEVATLSTSVNSLRDSVASMSKALDARAGEGVRRRAEPFGPFLPRPVPNPMRSEPAKVDVQSKVNVDLGLSPEARQLLTISRVTSSSSPGAITNVGTSMPAVEHVGGIGSR